MATVSSIETLPKREHLLASLLKNYDSSRLPALLATLPTLEATRLANASARTSVPRELSTDVETSLKALHPSWILELLQAEPPQLHSLFLTLLPTAGEGAGPLGLGVGQRRFFLSRLYRRLELNEVIPRALLPASACNTLLDLDQPRLLRLVGILGLYDIVAILRRQILPDIHKRVQRLLTEGEIVQLKNCFQQQDLLPPPKIDLTRWVIDRRHFRHLLELRGLIRLRLALHSASPSLIWHLARQLDVVRGRSLQGASVQALSPDLERRLEGQVIDLAHQLTLEAKEGAE